MVRLRPGGGAGTAPLVSFPRASVSLPGCRGAHSPKAGRIPAALEQLFEGGSSPVTAAHFHHNAGSCSCCTLLGPSLDPSPRPLAPIQAWGVGGCQATAPAEQPVLLGHLAVPEAQRSDRGQRWSWLHIPRTAPLIQAWGQLRVQGHFPCPLGPSRTSPTLFWHRGAAVPLAPPPVRAGWEHGDSPGHGPHSGHPPTPLPAAA